MHRQNDHRAALRTTVLLAVGLAFASAASAQYVWTDEKGTRIYSDTPPPASVPAGRVIKGMPAATSKTAAPAETGSGAARPGDGTSQAATPSPGGAAEPSSKGPPTLAEKNAEFNRRKAEREEKEKKTAEESRMAAEKQKNCERAREYRRLLDSGQRISTVDASGDRTVLTDERRAQESAETARILKDCR